MSEPNRILVVDDSPETVEVVERNLRSRDFAVVTAGGVERAIEILESNAVDLVITDLKMPGADGLELVRHVRDNFRDTEVVMITGYPSVEGAVEAVKTGAEEYLAKPFTDQELFAAVERALDKLALRRAGRGDGDAVSRACYGLIGDSPAMRRVHQTIGRAASTSATVLITGESGTGKELVARAIHYWGPRAAAPFVPVNCGGIPEGLLESELFGHMKGSFTGATDSRAGFFQTADGGTIFLDEISETSLTMQVKLLRVLQEREVRMVGSTRSRPVDVHVLAATNKDLRTLIHKGLFREDLYFRLNVITIDVPPLREHSDDVGALCHHFVTKFAKEYGRPAPGFSDRALQVLRGYEWPGNVRELENLMQRIVVMTDGDTVNAPDLPSRMRYSVSRESRLERTLAEVEADHIRAVLDHARGNKSQAARILGIDRKTLREKLRKTASHP